MRPRTSAVALTLFQQSLEDCSARVRGPRQLREPLRDLAGAEANEPGARQLEEMGRDPRLVAADRNDLRDRLATLGDDHFFARLDASPVLAKRRLQLGL